MTSLHPISFITSALSWVLGIPPSLLSASTLRMACAVSSLVWAVDAALLHEVGVLLVGAAVKDGHGCLHALHLRLLDVEQGCPGRGGVAALLVAEVELFAVLVAAPS